MSDSPSHISFPPWAEPYVPRFEEILRGIDLSPDFILFPIEAPSEDVAYALSIWLNQQNHPVTLIRPRNEDEWRDLPATLLRSRPRPCGVVQVIGMRTMSGGLVDGLRLLNQRRDSIVTHLACPLLFCGPKEFLTAVFERAPDFWSVRAEGYSLELPSYMSQHTEVRSWSGMWKRDLPLEVSRDLFRAAQGQGDRLNIARLGLNYAKSLVSELEFGLAAQVIQESLSGLNKDDVPPEQAQLHLVLAFIAMQQDDLQQAEDEVAKAQSFVGTDRYVEALVQRALGDLLFRRNRLREAEDAYRQALFIFRSLQDLRGEAATRRSTGHLYAQTGRLKEAGDAYEEALGLDRRTGEMSAQAATLLLLGSLLAQTFRFTEAETVYHQVLNTYRVLGNQPLREAITLLALGQLYEQAGRPQEAKAVLKQAQAIGHSIKDEKILDKAEQGLRSLRLSGP